jgi:hypothetical protein
MIPHCCRAGQDGSSTICRTVRRSSMVASSSFYHYQTAKKKIPPVFADGIACEFLPA